MHSGVVSIGGIDVRQLRLAELRAAIGMVFEDSFLFSDSIAANIAYGRPDASRAQVEAAAQAAEAAEFIAELPDGYDTIVGERGLTLSGGQRQRIALARALLTDPRIVLLDDATSAVDPRVEADILATLRQLIRGRTTLLIAHRRSTLALADRIAVLADGQVADIGTFDELMARCPLFRLLLGGPGEDAEGIDAGELAVTEPAAVSSRAVAAQRGSRQLDWGASVRAFVRHRPRCWPSGRDGRSRPAGRPARDAGVAGQGGRPAAGHRPAGGGRKPGPGGRSAVRTAPAAGSAAGGFPARDRPDRPGHRPATAAAGADPDRYRPRRRSPGCPDAAGGVGPGAGRAAGGLAGQRGWSAADRTDRRAAALHPAGEELRPAATARVWTTTSASSAAES